MTDKSELAAVKAELAAIKAQLNPKPPPTEAEVAAYQAKVHADREARATRSAAVGFSKSDLAAMRAAAPDDVCRDLARDARAPLNPRGVIPESEWNVRGRVSSGTGWSNPTPLRNGLGQGNWTDNAAFAPDRDRLTDRAKAADLARGMEKAQGKR
jgi:hypothetical protein